MIHLFYDNSALLSEELSRELQLLLRREVFVKFLHILILHIVPLRCLVYTGYAVKISRDQLPAKEEGIILSLRQIMVAYPKLPCEGEPAFAVKINVTLKNTVK